ncbi:MAG: hydrogenase 3 maturation endopeptidase HyCI [Candidatus Omnitrophica bacterium]|nr:hydrogenase 3 maturation endopeptidase HyCI [Candidatus Omnitrophota bacterium]
MDALAHVRLHLKDKVVIVGIGNTLRCDDGIGPRLAQGIMGKVPFMVWDAGVSPENYLGRVIKENPDTILLVDAIDFGGQPGEVRVVEADELTASNLFSTHNVSLELAVRFLQEGCRADILMLMIQPASLAFGEKLTPAVESALKQLGDWFINEGKEKR